MARLEGIEPPTHGLEIRCSILLSYRRRTIPPGSAIRNPGCCLSDPPGGCPTRGARLGGK